VKVCPDCGGEVVLIPGDEPYTDDHLMCSQCNGTFEVEET
jgi:uncharacterized protein YbaR (Trm112 family)